MCPTDPDIADNIVICVVCPVLLPIFIPLLLLTYIFEGCIKKLCEEEDNIQEEDNDQEKDNI